MYANTTSDGAEEMCVYLNGTPHTTIKGTTLADLLNALEINSQGVAIASGESIIPRHTWAEYSLQPHEELTLLRATCGG